MRRYPQLSAFVIGLSCRCPLCGQGAFSQGYLTVRETCEVCGLDWSKEDSGDGPAVFIIFIFGVTVVPLALWAEVLLELPLLRPFKATIVALQYRHRPPGQ